MATFTITPDAPFSLAAAAAFGFGPNTGRPKPEAGEMRLGFVTDDLHRHAAAHLTQAFAPAVDAGGEPADAFPTPRRLLAVEEFRGLEPARIGRLHAVARAA